MLQHKKSHARDGIVKIGVIKRGNVKGANRPQEHSYNINKGVYHWGTDAKLSEIRYPEGLIKNGLLTCHQCGKYEIEVSTAPTEMSLRAQALRIEMFRDHLSTCPASKSS